MQSLKIRTFMYDNVIILSPLLIFQHVKKIQAVKPDKISQNMILSDISEKYQNMILSDISEKYSSLLRSRKKHKKNGNAEI